MRLGEIKRANGDSMETNNKCEKRWMEVLVRSRTDKRILSRELCYFGSEFVSKYEQSKFQACF